MTSSCAPASKPSHTLRSAASLEPGRCGQKKKLVINGNKGGSPEDGVIMEQNGDTVKSQEMVQLVSRDQTNDFGDGDALTQEDSLGNAKDVNVKI
ncbi:hypothetical protein GDO81_021771 [Engystomops pustulosus]|uniref:Uncharacterized protein n=1 Tax=Engystomops pustulosus TaxID=76066 RepID=A0AAV6YVG2_ENGPU|nr:hypothetical protein GDO81_021771 [Engystomops pustulosus]